MKKIFIILSTMLLSVAFMQAQTEDKLAFTIYPSQTGNFEIWYSTYKAPSTRAVVVDWGDGNKIVYNTAYPDGANPKGKINGSVTKGKAIKVYSTCIDAIYIVGSMDWITPELSKESNCQYFYYLKENLSAHALENLYQGLNDRTGKQVGELYLLYKRTSQSDVPGDAPIRNANAFVTKSKNWSISSNTGKVGGKWSDRAHWGLAADVKSITDFLNSAFYMQAETGQTLKVGSMQMRGSYRGFTSTPITIVNDNKIVAHHNYPTAQSSETAFSTTGQVTATVGGSANQMFVYGAGVTHFSCEKAFVNGANTENLRYIEMYNSTQNAAPNKLEKQKQLKSLDLYGSSGLHELKVTNPNLEYLDVGDCPKLKTLSVTSTKLKELNLERTPLLPLSQYPDFSKLTSLTELSIANNKLDACDIDNIYNKLPKKSSGTNRINLNLFNMSNPNDAEGANHTLATAKKWKPFVINDSGNARYLTNDGQGCYHLSVGSTTVTKSNASRITGTGLSGTISYNRSTNTLTLNNATIKSSRFYGSGLIYFYGIESALGDFTVNLVGNNVIDIYENDSNIDPYDDSIGYGIYSSGKLTLKGTGSLHIKQVDCAAQGGQNYHDGLGAYGIEIDRAIVKIDDKGMWGSNINTLSKGLKLTNNATLICSKYIYGLNGHPTVYSGAVLEEGNSSSSMQKVTRLSLTKSSSGTYRTKHYVTIRPVGTDVETLTSQGIQVQGAKSEIRILVDTDEHKFASIYNMTGALVKVAELEGKETTVSNMQPGIYIVRIGTGAEKVVVR